MAAVTVTTAATLVVTGSRSAGAPDQVIITNDGGSTVFVGRESNVTVASGITLATGSSMGLELTAGRQVWAIVATGTNQLRVEAF